MTVEPQAATADELETIYAGRTPASATLMARARAVMPGGNTRDWTDHAPYPVVFQRASGPYLWDLDGHRYVDAFYNGLSIIHGHHFEPAETAIREALARGAPWPGASDKQVEFAEALCRRLETFERVSFTNSGSEAGMLAAKLVRHATGRPYLLKFWGAYHGSYHDLEAGLAGQPLAPGRTMLTEFGDAASFEAMLERHGKLIAGVFLEPVLVTEAVTRPPPDFLARVEAAARRAGALVVLDDCLMLRLAPGGSPEKFGLKPDLTMLGKFLGGGLPMGAVGGSEAVMRHLDPRRPGYLQHGGSYNGNVIACAAGLANLEHLTGEAIQQMDAAAEALDEALSARAAALGLPTHIVREGSVMGVFFGPEPPTPPIPRRDRELQTRFRLACLNRGVSPGPSGQFAMATSLRGEALELLIEGACAALEDLTHGLSARDIEGLRS